MHRCWTIAALLSALYLYESVAGEPPTAPEPSLPPIVARPGALESPTLGAAGPARLAPVVSPGLAPDPANNSQAAGPSWPIEAGPLAPALQLPTGNTAATAPPANTSPIPPYPAIQQQPIAIGQGPVELHYPGQDHSGTYGSSPWPRTRSAQQNNFGALAPLPTLRSSLPLIHVSDQGHDPLLKAKAAATGVFATVDYLYWQLRRRDLDYAITSQPGAMVFSDGEIHELEHPSEPGVRTVMGYEFATGWQIGIGYMNYDSTSSGTAEDGAGTLFATRSHPDINRRAGIATADASFDMRVLDLEVRNSVELGERATMALFGSFRWADIDQAFHVFYDEIEFPIGGDVTSLLQTQAFGVRIGADGKWSLTPHLYLVGTAETSILFSDNALSLTETEGTTTILNLADSYEQALPVLGTRVGGGYSGKSLSVEAGYEMQAWFDLGDRMSFLDDQHLGVFAHSNHNVLMDGFYLRLGWNR